jgi:hypothetical protein
MGRQRRDDKHEAAQLTERMQVIAERVWQGNQARMAEDLGVSRPVISRVLTGKQQPTGKLLAALLRRHPDVNLHWLLSGHGEPFIEPGVEVGGGRLRPVVDDLLPGPPDEHPGLLSGLGYPVAAAFDAPSRYWYRIPAGAAVLRRTEEIALGGAEKIASGDLLLVETSEKWTRRWGAVIGKFCAIRHGKGRRERILLGQVDATGNVYIEDYETFRVDLFGEEGKAWLVVADTPAGVEVGRRAVSGEVIVLEQVVGVCVLLERPFERQLPRQERGPSAG